MTDAGRRPRAAARVAAWIIAATSSWSALCPVAAASSTDPLDVSLEVVGSAKVYGDGGSLVVKIEVRCPADIGYTNLFIRATQTIEGGATASGRGYVDLRCDGSAQQFNIATMGGGPAFQPTGQVKVRAELSECPPWPCIRHRTVDRVGVETGRREQRAFGDETMRYRLPKLAKTRHGRLDAVVAIHYECHAAAFGYLDAALVATGSDGTNVWQDDFINITCCDGRVGRLVLSVDPAEWPRDGVLIVHTQVCLNDTTCAFSSTYREVKIR